MLNTLGRGIPTGYISSLEHRLLETEFALFRTLFAIHYPRDDGKQLESRFMDTFAQETSTQNKSAKVDEWTRFSLGSDSQLLAWVNEKRRNLEAVPTDRKSSVSQPPASAAQLSNRQWYGPEIHAPRMAPQGALSTSWQTIGDNAVSMTEAMQGIGSDATPDNSEDLYSPRSRDFALQHRETELRPVSGLSTSTLLAQKRRASGVQWEKYF